MSDTPAMRKMPRGAIPTDRATIAAATRHIADASVEVPSSYLLWPDAISYWGNDEYGDCVCAEEAFAKVAANPYIFVSDEAVTGFASQYGYLNGANIHAVLTTMQNNGMSVTG